MFHVTLPEGNIAFSFQHIRGTNFEVRPGKLVTDITKCDFLLDGKAFSGLAACAAGDKFEKETGRKVALKRAMQDAKLSRDSRTMIWGRYLNRHVKGML